MSEENGTEATELPEDAGKVDLEPLKGYDPELYQVMNRRVGTLYGTTKELRKTIEQQGKDMRFMLDELKSFRESTQSTEREQILEGIKTASEEGDHEKVATLTDRLTRLNSNSKGNSPDATPEPPKAEDTAESKDGKETPDLSEYMSSEDEARLAKWTNERDNEGNLVRPWLQENHPKYKRAMAAAQAVMADEGLNPAQMMQEIDSIMGTQKQSSPQSQVLSPGMAPRKGASKPKATPEQIRVADAMGVKIDEYMAIYDQSEKYQDGSMVKVLELED